MARAMAVVAAAALLLALLSRAAADEGPAWRWRCEGGRCVRFAQAAGAAGAGRPSLALCRLTCGPAGALWPRPSGAVQLGAELTPLGTAEPLADVSAVQGEPGRRFLLAAAARLGRDLARQCPGAGPRLRIVFHTADPALALGWDTDETYRLAVDAVEGEVVAEVRAHSVYGARHALETLAQLTACAEEAGAGLRAVASARVRDGPAYPHRGLLLDTARHWLPEAALLRAVDALAAVKMNVLHWHATDSHSFPLLLPRRPLLARWGAYSPERSYPAAAVARVLAYGRARGVRVLLELDGPAHAGSGWQWGPELGLGELAVCAGRQPWRSFCIQPPCGQLDPTNPALYGVLRDVFADLLELLPADEPLHLGGDEVHLGCWNATPAITDWLQRNGSARTTADFHRLWARFHAEELRLLDEQRGHTRTPALLWSSHLADPDGPAADRGRPPLDPNRFVIQTWVQASDPLPARLLGLGFSLVVSTKNAWYLDHGMWGNTRYYPWQQAYEARLPRPPAARAAGRVLGGEAALWGEQVDDEAVDSLAWPRTAAVAERLWTDPSSPAEQAEPRLLQLRERLVGRGVRAAAVSPEWCVLNEGECSAAAGTRGRARPRA